MERLNNILGRPTPRRQPTSNYPIYRGTSSASSRVAQQSQLPIRQQSPEQVARLRLKYPSGSQPQQLDHVATNAHHPQDEPAVSRQPSRTADQERGGAYHEPSRYHTSPLQHSENKLPRYRHTGRLQPQARQESPSSTQYSRPIQPLLPSAASKTGHHHHADDYISNAYGDVMDEWNDEEDAEDEGIRYGDWENNEPVPSTHNRKPELEILPNPSIPHPTYRRETDVQLRHQTRDSRDIYTNAILNIHTPTSLTQLPYPTTRMQKIQQYQRTTQPLNPESIAELEREHGLTRPDAGKKIMSPRSLREQAIQTQQHLQQPPTPPIAILPVRNVCSKCQGAGYLRAEVPFGDPHFGKAIACECKEVERREKRRQQLREMSNLDALRDQSFETFNARVPGVQEAYNTAFTFAKNSEGWLLLIGPNGCGKTHLAAAVANQALESGALVLFEPVPDLLDHLRAAFAPSSNEVYDQLFAKMREAEVLILDDLGAQQSSPWANEKLFQLLNYRYNMGMPTVITANLKGIQGVDERIRSRLSDTALVLTVHMDRAYDYRPKRPKRY